MNKLASTLFNDGNNNGNLSIVCNNNEKIKCSSFVLKTQTFYFEPTGNYSLHKKQVEDPLDLTSKEKKIILNYNSELVKTLLNKMYNDKYKLNQMSIENVLELMKLIEDLCLTFNKEKIIDEINEVFKSNLNEQNWLEVLQQIFDNPLYDNLKNVIFDFIVEVILSKEDITELPENIDLNTEIGKKLISLYIKKINDSNKNYKVLEEKFHQAVNPPPKKRGPKKKVMKK